jgi:hypothetical protein
MTAVRFEPHGDAGANGQGQAPEPTGGWEQAGSWERAEAWEYDEACANPEPAPAYDSLEARLISDREPAARFDRFDAAVADAQTPTMPLLPDPEAHERARAGWLEAVGRGRFWASALWLVGAAATGLLAGLISTHLVALALDSEGPRPVAAASVASTATAPVAVPPRAARHARAAGDDAAATPRIAGLAPAPAAASSGPASQSVISSPTAAAGPAEPGNARLAPPSAKVLQLAALVEPAPGLPQPAAASADRAEPAPTPPAAAAEARVAMPPATVRSPQGQYRVQLALLRDARNVDGVWQDFVARFGPAASKLRRYVVPTRTAHGLRQLVQVGAFEDQDHADAVCDRLKQRGGDCFVVRQPS